MATAEILKKYATELKAKADFLMQNRASLEVGYLNEERKALANLRALVIAQLAPKQQDKFNAIMDEVEDFLDTLIRQIIFGEHASKSFMENVRKLSGFLYAAASLIWSLTAIFFSLHPQP